MPSIINSDDGSVSGAAGLKFTSGSDGILQIQNNGNTAISVADTGIVTFAQPPLTAVPAFYAYRDGNQSITTVTLTVVALNAELFDTENWFDTSTYRYTPQIAGYYQFNACTYIVSTSGATRGLITIVKNGTDNFRGAYLPTYNGVNWAASAGVLIYMNGSTDYVNLVAYQQATSPVIQGAATGDTFLSGFLVRAT